MSEPEDKIAQGIDEPRIITKDVRVIREEIQLEEEDDDDDNGVAVDADDEDLLAALSDDTEEIDLIHARLATLSNLRLSRFGPYLKRLCVRQNFLSSLEPEEIAPLKKLEELDIYDNKFKRLGDALQNLPLKVLDASFNLLPTVPEVLQTLASLHTIYLIQNKISRIDGLSALGATLRSLELGGNRIRQIENLDALVNLEELWLGRNKITKLENLQNLQKLRLLSIQSNRITKIEGLDSLSGLEEIYLSHNGIEKLEGLDHNTNLTMLDITSNQVAEIENISHLKQLKELWASENQIKNVHSLDTELGSTATLETIYLEGNPCQRDDMAGYRRKVILALPQVQQVDATFVKQV